LVDCVCGMLPSACAWLQRTSLRCKLVMWQSKCQSSCLTSASFTLSAVLQVNYFI